MYFMVQKIQLRIFIIFVSKSNTAEANYISNLLANVTWNSDHTNVISASAYMTTWILRMPEEDSYTDDKGSYVDPIAERWETEFIELLATDEGYSVS